MQFYRNLCTSSVFRFWFHKQPWEKWRVFICITTIVFYDFSTFVCNTVITMSIDRCNAESGDEWCKFMHFSLRKQPRNWLIKHLTQVVGLTFVRLGYGKTRVRAGIHWITLWTNGTNGIGICRHLPYLSWPKIHKDIFIHRINNKL
jgi:hypothetical protein